MIRAGIAGIAATVVLMTAAPANADDGCLLCDPPSDPVTVTQPAVPVPPPAPAVEAQPDPTWRSSSPYVDHRPCVSSREFHSVKRWTRSELETRWEVVGLGKQEVLIAIGAAMVYPRCAYKPSEALYAIAYRNGRVHVAVEFKEVGAQPHGRP